MTSGVGRFIIRKAIVEDLSAIKRLADQHKNELGFIIQGALKKSIEQGEILVSKTIEGELCAFVQYRHRKDDQTTLYNLVVTPSYRRQGIAQSLLIELVSEARSLKKTVIILKCPTELPANEFYRISGFKLVETDSGKQRPLNIWKLVL